MAGRSIACSCAHPARSRSSATTAATARTRSRPYLDEGIELVYGLYDAAREQLDREGWFVLDNSDLSPDEAAARIVAQAGLG